MELKKAIEKRYSVRGYLDKSVDKDTVKNILEVAKKAPSGVNSQPWKVYVVMGNVRDNLVKEACEKFDKGEMEKEEYQVYPTERPDWYKARQRGSGFALYGALGIEKEDMDKRMKQARKNYEFFDAPVGIFITVHRSVGPNGWGHVGHFVQNICLAAVDAGLATCLQEAWAGFPNLIKKYTKYSDEEILWCGIALGHEDSNHPANSFRTEREEFESYAKILE
ncbi:MAG: nitroreductase [Gammaproteobacteria bacterium]|tara:strand:+ start:1989 stop:2654 length:666 start_codon:yes stop_codon:yes gene_type:complete